MQLAAAGRKFNILYCHCLFEGNLLRVHWNGNNHIKNFIWGGILWDVRSEITFFTPLTCHHKYNFLTVYPTINLANLKF